MSFMPRNTSVASKCLEHRNHWVLLLVLLLPLWSGCASLETWEPPGVSLANLQLQELTALETSAVIEVRLANTNRDPIVVEGATYNLYIDGLRVGQALSNEVIEIAALSTEVQTAELYLSNLALVTRLQPLLQNQAFDYEIRGKVYVNTGVRTRKMRVNHLGSFDFQEVTGSLEAGDRRLTPEPLE